MSVRPLAFSGWSMTGLQIFGIGPKFEITCGACNLTFGKRIPMTNNPGVKCPNCGEVNVLPVIVSNGA